MIMPIRGHPMRTIIMPEKKAIEPFNLCFWKKNQNVLSKPIMNAKPERKSIWKLNVHLKDYS